MSFPQLGPLSFRLAELLNNIYRSGNLEIPGHTSTALHYHVERKWCSIVSLLVENRADVKAVFKSGEKPFNQAVSLGYDDIALS